MDVAPVFHPARSKYLLITTDYLVPLFLSLGILSIIYLVLFSPVFNISSVSCTLDFEACHDLSVIAEGDKLKGQNIFRLKSDQIRTRLTSGDFTIREVRLTKTLPSSVMIELQSIYPVVALQIQGDPTYIVMDPQFRVIATRRTDPNVPTVIVPGPLTVTVGKVVPGETIIETLKLALTLSEELVSIKQIGLINDNTIELTLKDGLKALFTPKKDLGQQLKSLQVILADDTIKQGVRTVDVRFSQPVLRP